MLTKNDFSSKIQFEVNPTVIASDLCSKRLQIQSIVAHNPSKRKGLESIGVLGTPLDAAVVGTIKKSGKKISQYSLIGNGNNVYEVMKKLPYKEPKEVDSWFGTHMTVLFDCPETALPEVLEIIPECKSLLQTDAGKVAFHDTVLYKNSLERLWERYEHSIDEYVKGVVGESNLQSKGKKLTVSIMPQVYKNQKINSAEKDSTIFYYSLPKARSEAQKQDDNAYTIASFAHAKVHETYLPYKLHMTKDEKDRFHAFIKFLTDKEIYHQITGKSYFDIDTTQENGEIMAKVYPYWLGYLYRKSSNPVSEIQNDINRERKAYERLKGNSKKRKLYEGYNLDRLSAQKIANFFVGKRGMTPYEFAKIDFDNRDAVENLIRTNKIH